MNNEVIMLVGLPGSGKSTYIENVLGGEDNYFILSNDNIREKISKANGFTYDDTFVNVPDYLLEGEYLKNKESYGPIILTTIKLYDGSLLEDVKVFEELHRVNMDISSAFEVGKKLALKQSLPIIIDMTNLNEKGRKTILDEIGAKPENVTVINFMSKSPDFLDNIKTLATIREEELKVKGRPKTIPMAAYDRMFDEYEPPKKEEGFKSIKEPYEGVDFGDLIKEIVNKDKIMENYDNIDIANGTNF